MNTENSVNDSMKYDNYPGWIVVLSNIASFSIYALGSIIMARLSWIIAIIYLTYTLLIMEYRILKYHCINCYYYGKICGFGKGRLSGWFFKKGDASKFCSNEFSWKDMIPDLLVSLIPFITGIVLLIVEFDLAVLFALLLLIFLTTIGNGFVRGKLTCSNCRQRELGCPAYELFNKKKS